MHVEARLNANTASVHPYCLSLDSIGNVLYSLLANKCVVKQTVAGIKPNVHYVTEAKELDQLSQHLRRYCSAFTGFNALSNYAINAKL